MIIGTSLPSPQEKGTEIKIYIQNQINDSLEYKFLAKCSGGWETLKDYSSEKSVTWTPNEEGKYMIMVLGRDCEDSKHHTYTSRLDFIIGKAGEKIISDVYISNKDIVLGEKVEIEVIPSRTPVMCKYWIKDDDGKWEIVKDYTLNTNLSFTPDRVGKIEMLVECKDEISTNQFDDFENIEFNVEPLKQVRINNIKCLTADKIINNELTFEVESSYDKSRVMMYKFIKIDEFGNMHVVQDYSSKRLVSFTELIPGKYKLLCMVKDMYSREHYDDRAVVYYKVLKYKPVKIDSFTSDLSTPQVENTAICFKAICSGGNQLLYKFVVEGECKENAPFSKQSTFMWKPNKKGTYKITVLVKDSTCREDYEEKSSMDFVIEQDCAQNVYIRDVKVNTDKTVLINEPVSVEVEAAGAEGLLYEFIVKKEGKKEAFIEYSTKSSMDLIPDKEGKYEIEAKVKHPKSKREFDAHSIIYIECKKFIPASIDYVLTDRKSMYILGEEIEMEVITKNTENTLVKYVVEIDNRDVETIDFCRDKKFKLMPRCAGIYTVKIYCKNENSTNEYDCKKEMIFDVLEGIPITNTRITLDKDKLKCNEDVNFYVNCEGGKDVLYEFYLMEHGDWKLIQRYSKKNYYTFMPFYSGEYRILALCKSSYSKRSYDDYCEYSVKCE